MRTQLPRILVIDDQYGSDADLRDEFCSTRGIVEIDLNTTDDELRLQAEERLAGAVFSSAQRRTGRSIENSLEEAEFAVGAGWPSHQGWRWALVLLDLRFDSSRAGAPEDEYFGLRILERLVARWPDPDRRGNSEIPIVVLSSMERIRYGGDANRAGAAEYIEKNQLSRDELQRLLDRHGLLEDPNDLLLGRSPSLLRTLRSARRAANDPKGNLLILGEQSTGKTELARYIHQASPRGALPFQRITVSFGMEPHLLKTQLFGFWYGAYTPADKSEAGVAERAHKGVLFIDEIANLPPTAHQELLEYARLNKEGLRRLNRLGTFPSAPRDAVEQAKASVIGHWEPKTQALLVDTFVLAATNRPIDDDAYRAEAGFPHDLFVRLAQEYHTPIKLPSLRDRKQDIVPMFMSFLEEESRRTHGVWPKSLDREVTEAIEAHHWGGNVGELKGYAKRVATETWPWDEVIIERLPPLSPTVGQSRSKVGTPTSGPTAEVDVPANCLAHAIAVLNSIEVHDSRNELQGSLNEIGRAYGALLQRLLSSSLEATRDMSTRDKDELLGDLSPTRAISLLLNESIRTDKAADIIKRLASLFPEAPASDSDIGRVLAWAVGLRGSRKKTPSTKES